MSIAYAHAGEVHLGLSWTDLLTHFTLDPVFLPPMVLLVWLYLRGLRLRRERRMILPTWRVVCFGAGVVALALGLFSGLDILAESSFTGHMIQHMLIMQVGTPLLLLGAPFLPVVRGLPRVLRWKAFVPMANARWVRGPVLMLFRPVPAFAVYALVFAFWHLPGFHNAAIRSDFFHYLQHASFGLGSLFFWWNLISPYPFTTRLNPFMRVGWLFLISVVNTAVSSVVTWSRGCFTTTRIRSGIWAYRP